MSNELKMIEIPALRSELNSVIDRMNFNENFCISLISALTVVVLSETGFFQTDLPAARVGFSIMAVCVVIFGIRRHYECVRHVEKLDKYLAESETHLASEGGWSSKYLANIEGRPTKGFSGTRVTFWSILMFITVILLGYTLHSILCQ